MMSKVEAQKKLNYNLDEEKLAHHIEAITGTLSLDESVRSLYVSGPRPKSADRASTSRPSLKSKHGSDHPSHKDKKSFWNWKPLKALSHARHQRFNCGFTLEVHTIEGLPSELNDLSISVSWKKRDEEIVSNPIKVANGVAEFGEKLLHTCSVYGSRGVSHNSAKYEAKHFLLYAAILGNPDLDLGKHRIDLTKLLPLTLEELEGEKSSGSWTTSFKLSGKAKGAVMNVTFGYVVLGNNVSPSNKNVLKLLGSNSTIRSNTESTHDEGSGSIRRSESCPTNQGSSDSSMRSRSVDDVQALSEEATPERMSDLSSSLSTLYEKFDYDRSSSLRDDKSEIATSVDDFESLKSASCAPSESSWVTGADEHWHTDFSVIDKGIKSMEETLGLDQTSPEVNNRAVEESPDLIQGSAQEEHEFIRDECVAHDLKSKQKEMSTKESLLEDLESVFNHVSNLEKEVLGTLENKSESSDWGNEDEDKANRTSRSNLGDISVSNIEEEELDTPEAESERPNDRENEVDGVLNGITQSHLDDVLDSVANLKKQELDIPEAESEESSGRVKTTQSNLDNVVESVTDEFVSNLGREYSPISLNYEEEEFESPRERLLKEFEKEVEASGCPIFGYGINDINEEVVAGYEEEIEVDCNYRAPTVSGWEEDFWEDSDRLPIIEPESPGIIAKISTEYPKIRAKVVEDLEPEDSYQEWGLDERYYESLSPSSTGDSPIYLSPKNRHPLPSLGEGLGSFIRTKNGGFLCSMNPVLFRNARSGGSLIMQVSSPVVVPADLGSEVMQILQTLASLGLEQLSLQANKLMRLEEISGMTLQQIAREAAPVEASQRHEGAHVTCPKATKDREYSTSGNSKNVYSNFTADEVYTEYVVSLDDLTHLAMDKIEALSIEGLRIQCSMEDEEDAPSSISAKSIGEFPSLKGKRTTSIGTSIAPVRLDGAVGLQLLNLEENETNENDGLLGLSLTLDEWIKLDSGEINEYGETSERTSKILAAHHGYNFLDLNNKGKAPERSSGLLGNNFTVSLMIQLQDPSRNYEPVGMPMLGLIQVERLFLLPKPKIYTTMPKVRYIYDDEDDELEFKDVDELIPQFKINHVHIAGLRNEPGKKNPWAWGSASQERSASQWLLANEMVESGKNPFMKSELNSEHSDALWSISSRFFENASPSNQLGIVCAHIRNPDVIFRK